MTTRVIYFANGETKEYFWSTDHCQRFSGSATWIEEGFVPVTVPLPHSVRTRESLPGGVVRTKQDVAKIYLYDMKEIPNPDPKFQPPEVYTPQQLIEKAMSYHYECMNLRCDFKKLSDLITSALKTGYQHGIDREEMDIPEAL